MTITISTYLQAPESFCQRLVRVDKRMVLCAALLAVCMVRRAPHFRCHPLAELLVSGSLLTFSLGLRSCLLSAAIDRLRGKRELKSYITELKSYITTPIDTTFFFVVGKYL